MTPGVRNIDGHQQAPVTEWQAQATEPGAEPNDAAWLPADLTLGQRHDGQDFWFRARLPSVEGAEVALVFGGIATLADVWVDGEHRFSSDNMFVQRETASGSEVRVHCRALDFSTKRPRPRWRVPMIENQQLRWFRTTLLGRTPGWSPPFPVVGPWRPVVVESRNHFAVDEVGLRPRTPGVVDVSCKLRPLDGKIEKVELVVGEHRVALSGDGSGRLELSNAARWWPHTHGDPTVYPAHLDVDGRKVELGAVGFREITRDGEFGVTVNGKKIFARGACWTPLDLRRLISPRSKLETALIQARDAGMNMLRVGGTMVYESDDFYDLCDRLGILVWQDFMFANMDYPEDEAFVANVTREVRQIVARLQARPSVAVLCGSSEGEQQAAMWGAPRERWSPPLFHQMLPELARDVDAIYWPSSAHGGAFPHQADRGTTSYYGVGAYLRPLEDARRSEVRFASECLAFANIPAVVEPWMRVHHPEWKQGVPRDLGAGWDFDDVRDHYVKELFRVDPAALRYSDHERYLALGRVATGEVMAQTFGEWRRARSLCRGALVWFLRDLRPGAGWGVVDSSGAPKPAWYYLKRALQPLAVHLSDEGVNGVTLHVANDGPAISAEIEITCWRAGEVQVATVRRSMEIGAALELPLAELLDGFADLSWAYRFGPPAQDLIVATVNGAHAFYFPVGLPNSRELDVGLTAEVRDEKLWVKTRRFAQSVAVDLEGFRPDDNYFHLPPGGERTIGLHRLSGTHPPRGTLQPLNAETAARLR